MASEGCLAVVRSRPPLAQADTVSTVHSTVANSLQVFTMSATYVAFLLAA